MHKGVRRDRKAYCINGEMPEEEIGTRVTVFSGSAAEKRVACANSVGALPLLLFVKHLPT